MNSWRFDPVLPATLLTVLLLGLFIAFAAVEWRRSLPRKYLRLLSTFFLFLSLAGLFFRPSFLNSGSSAGFVLLSSGFDPAKADSLRVSEKLKVLKTADAAFYPGAQELTSLTELAAIGSGIRYVLGEGLPAYAFEYFEPSFEYLPADQPAGIVSLKLSPEVKANRKSLMSGQIKAVKNAQWMRLKGPGGGEDSLQIQESAEDFTLGFMPKLAVNFLYQLEILDSSFQTLDSLPVPVQVAAERQLNILIIQQFPVFETRYLKNLLGGQGHEVAIRSRVSEGKFRYEFANQSAFSFGRLNEDLLENADLLFIDQNTLAAMSTAEQTALGEAVQKGLGVLVWAGEIPTSQRMKSWLPFDFHEVQNDTTHIVTDFGRASLTVPAFRIRADAGTFPLWRNPQDQLLAAYAYKGWGAIGTVLWGDSYRLVLNGLEHTYAALWMEVIDAVARKESSCCKVEWQSKAPYYQDEPMQFRLLSGGEEPAVFYRGEKVPLKENWQLENVWHGTVWPTGSGWDSLTVEGMDRPVYWYVHEQTEWASIAAAERIRLNTIMGGISGDEKDLAFDEMKKRVPQLIFYLLFLLAAGGLWLAPKV